jgi:hypothetical protein
MRLSRKVIKKATQITHLEAERKNHFDKVVQTDTEKKNPQKSAGSAGKKCQ